MTPITTDRDRLTVPIANLLGAATVAVAIFAIVAR